MSTAGNVIDAGTKLLTAQEGLSTAPMLAAIFYVLLIFLALYIIVTFGLWNKLQAIIDGTASSFSSHMDDGTGMTINSITANPIVNSESRRAKDMNGYAYAGFRSHATGARGVTIPTATPASQSFLLSKVGGM